MFGNYRWMNFIVRVIEKERRNLDKVPVDSTRFWTTFYVKRINEFWSENGKHYHRHLLQKRLLIYVEHINLHD